MENSNSDDGLLSLEHLIILLCNTMAALQRYAPLSHMICIDRQ
jgi:hypothetical protein